jgi:hypothetical protein
MIKNVSDWHFGFVLIFKLRQRSLGEEWQSRKGGNLKD